VGESVLPDANQAAVQGGGNGLAAGQAEEDGDHQGQVEDVEALKVESDQGLQADGNQGRQNKDQRRIRLGLEVATRHRRQHCHGQRPPCGGADWGWDGLGAGADWGGAGLGLGGVPGGAVAGLAALPGLAADGDEGDFFFGLGPSFTTV
jgi:hypothetical protein